MPIRPRLPGLAVALVLAAVATASGRAVPVLGTPVVAIALGAAVGLLLRRNATERFEPGFAFTRQQVLAAAIVVMGLGLPIGTVAAVGRSTALVLFGTFAVGGVCAFALGRALALQRDSALLIALGTMICGASAIAAATAVIKPPRDRVAYALGTIFVFNVLAVLVYPAIGRAIGLSDTAFGLWVGTAVNDTSSVLAAAAGFSSGAVSFAAIVKLTRSLLIVPVCVGLHFGWRRDSATPQLPLWRSVPASVVLFVAASALASTGMIPAALTPAMSSATAFLIAAVLAAIGSSLTWAQVRSAGLRPLLFGGVLGACVAGSSLALQAATGWW